jgi:hypothetical protein
MNAAVPTAIDHPYLQNNNKEESKASAPLGRYHVNGQRTLKDLVFGDLYSYYCSKQHLDPILSIVENAQRNILEIDLDYLPEEHYNQMMLALCNIGSGRSNRTLSFKEIAIRWHESNDARYVVDNRAFLSLKTAASTLVKDSMALRNMQSTGHRSNNNSRSTRASSKNRFITLVGTVDINQTLKMVKALSNCMTDNVSRLEIEGLYLTRHCTAMLNLLMRRQKNMLTHLSLHNSMMGDECFEEIGQALVECFHLVNVRLSGCNLTDKSLVYVVTLLKDKSEKIAANEWQSSLRGGHGRDSNKPQFKVLDNIKEELDVYDVKSASIDLSDNYIGDSGALVMSKFIGNMMRALDLSKNLLGARGISALLEAIVQQKELLMKKDMAKRMTKYLNVSHNAGVIDAQLPTGIMVTRFSKMDLILSIPDPKRSLSFKRKQAAKKAAANAKKKRLLLKKKNIKKLFANSDKKKKKDESDSESGTEADDTTSTSSSMLSCVGRMEDNSEETVQERMKKDMQQDRDRFVKDSELIHLRIQNQRMLGYLHTMKDQIIKLQTKLTEKDAELKDLKDKQRRSTPKKKKPNPSARTEDHYYNELEHVTKVNFDSESPSSPVTSDITNEENEEITRRLSELW